MAKKDWNPILQAAPGVETPKKFQQFLDRGEAGKQAFKDAQEVKQILPKETGKFDTLQKVVDLLGLIPGPAAAGKAGMTAIMGAITPGGLRKLALTHNTRPANLEQILNSGFLDVPSLAVTKNKPASAFGGTTLVMNPRKLDPDINPSSHMTNRDAYTPDLRQLRQFYGNNYAILNSRPSRLAQQATPVYMQDLAIRASPDFGFRSYQKSPAGAATLDKPYLVGEEDIAKFLGVELPSLYSIPPESAFKEIVSRAAKKDKEALSLLKKLKQTGSNYAEVKVLDRVPVDKDNVLGVIFPESTKANKGLLDDLKLDLRGRGIPAGDVSELLPERSLARLGTPSAMDEVLQSITSRAFK